MEMHPTCQRISLASILFVPASSRKATPYGLFRTTVIAETLQQTELADSRRPALIPVASRRT
jgi:hypothetical protein